MLVCFPCYSLKMDRPGVCIVAKQGKPQHGTPKLHARVFGTRSYLHIPVIFLLLHLERNKIIQEFGFCQLTGDSDEVPTSWLPFSPSLAGCRIWGVNSRRKIYFSIYPSIYASSIFPSIFCITLSKIN